MSFRDIELKPEYRSRLDNVIRDFYNPVLKQAVTYGILLVFGTSFTHSGHLRSGREWRLDPNDCLAQTIARRY